MTKLVPYYADKSVKVRPAWCEEHGDFSWLYDDGSGGCFTACILEMGSSDCRLVPLKALQRAKR
jgi:hypothetical protein